jgi:uncharacterized protein (DUF4415 family)
MPFQKGHKDRFQSDNPLDDKPLTIRLDKGVRDKIKQIPDWQNKVRDLLKNWVENQID